MGIKKMRPPSSGILMLSLKLLVLVTMPISLLSHPAHAQTSGVPDKFSFQGVVSELADGTYPMKLQVRNGRTPFTSGTVSVPVVNGVFVVSLTGLTAENFYALTASPDIRINLFVTRNGGEDEFDDIPLTTVPSAYVAQMALSLSPETTIHVSKITGLSGATLPVRASVAARADRADVADSADAIGGVNVNVTGASTNGKVLTTSGGHFVLADLPTNISVSSSSGLWISGGQIAINNNKFATITSGVLDSTIKVSATSLNDAANNGTINGSLIFDGSIGSAQIGAKEIKTANINDGAVGATQLSSALNTTINGKADSSDIATAISAIPTATDSVPGLLTAADHLAFNGKQAALGFTPINKAGDSLNGHLQINNQNELRFGDTGSHYAALKAADDLTANLTWILPNSAGSSGEYLRLGSGGELLWSTPTFSLGMANPTTLGGVRIQSSSGLSINNANGDLSVDFGTGTNQAVRGDDSRLSDARAPIAHTHTSSQISDLPAMIGATVNSIPDATASIKGLLSSTDWSTFNNKMSSVNLPAMIGATVNAIPDATASIKGLLSSNDWSTFNNKMSSVNLPAMIGATVNALPNSNVNISAMIGATVNGIPDATASIKGLLSSTDWSTFNNKMNSVNLPAMIGATVNGIPDATASIKGLLSNTDWSTFNGKQAALGFTPVNKAGDTMSGSLQLANQNSVQFAGTSNTFVGFKAPDSIANNVTWTLPSADGAGNQVLQTSGSGILTWVTPAAGSVTAVGGSGTVSTSGSGTITISVSTATGSTNGILTSTDWSIFNSKQDALGFTPANSTDISTINTALLGKEDTLPKGNVLSAGSIVVSGATTNSVIGGGLSITVTTANTSTNGVLTSTDWNIFNNKQDAIVGVSYLSGMSANIQSQIIDANSLIAANALSTATSIATKQDALGYTPLNKAGDTMSGHLVINNQKELRFGDTDTHFIGLRAPDALANSLHWTLPAINPTDQQILKYNSATDAFVWSADAGGAAGVNGPGTTAIDTIPRWANTSGTGITGSNVTLDASNNISGIAILSASSATITNLLMANELRASGLTGSTSNVLSINSQGSLFRSSILDSELAQLQGLTANVHAQLDMLKNSSDSLAANKVNRSGDTMSGPLTVTYLRATALSGGTSNVLSIDSQGQLFRSNVLDFELAQLQGLTSNVNAQLDQLKASSGTKISRTGDTMSGGLTAYNFSATGLTGGTSNVLSIDSQGQFFRSNVLDFELAQLQGLTSNVNVQLDMLKNSSGALAGGKLNKSGDSMNGALLLVDGAVGAPGLAFASDTDTGLFHTGADEIGFNTGGVTRMTLTNGGLTSNFPLKLQGLSGSTTNVVLSNELGALVGSNIRIDELAQLSGATTNIQSLLNVLVGNGNSLAGNKVNKSGDSMSGGLDVGSYVRAKAFDTDSADSVYRIGGLAMLSIGTAAPGNNNLIVGGSGHSMTSGAQNTFAGRYAGSIVSTGGGNSLFGFYAGANMNTAQHDSYMGTNAGAYATGSDNSFVGYYAGAAAGNTGTDNAFLGSMTGGANTSGSYNTYLGYRSGQAATIGSSNTLVGKDSGYSLTTGDRNTLVGETSNTSAGTIEGTAIGYHAVIQANSAVQIGEGTNTLERTMQFNGFNFLNDMGGAKFSTVDVGGTVKIGGNAVTCTVAGDKGLTHYNTTTDKLEFCDGTGWVPMAAAIGSVAGVSLSSPATGQVLTFNGTNWVNDINVNIGTRTFTTTGAVSTGTLTAGTLNISGNVYSSGNLVLNSAGSANVNIGHGGGSSIGLQVHDPGTSLNNYLQVAGSATGTSPVISAQGSTDTNVSIVLKPLGTGNIVLGSGALEGAASTGGAVAGVNAILRGGKGSSSGAGAGGNAIVQGGTGIDTTSPGGDTFINGGTSGGGATSGGAIHMQTTANNGSMVERMLITPGGNVGINLTAAPSEILQVGGSLSLSSSNGVTKTFIANQYGVAMDTSNVSAAPSTGAPALAVSGSATTPSTGGYTASVTTASPNFTIASTGYSTLGVGDQITVSGSTRTVASYSSGTGTGTVTANWPTTYSAVSFSVSHPIPALKVGGGLPIHQITSFTVSTSSCSPGSITVGAAFYCSNGSPSGIPVGPNASYYSCTATSPGVMIGNGAWNNAGSTFYVAGIITSGSGSISGGVTFNCMATTF